MGIHIGPYFECKTERVPQQQPVERACPNAACFNHRAKVSVNAKFCPECGTAAETVDFTFSNIAVSHWTVSERTEENLYLLQDEETSNQTTHRYAPNISVKNPKVPLGYKVRGFVIDEGTSVVEMDADTIQGDRLYLADNFVDEERVLRELYGKDNVTIKWGVIANAWEMAWRDERIAELLVVAEDMLITMDNDGEVIQGSEVYLRLRAAIAKAEGK